MNETLKSTPDVTDDTSPYQGAHMEDSELFSGEHDLRGQLELLRERLLDLTGRNRLLNFRHTTRSSLRIVDELPGQIFDALLNGKSFLFEPVPEPTDPELKAYWQERGRPVQDEEGNPLDLEKPAAREWARRAGIHTDWEAPLPLPGAPLAPKHDDRFLQTLHYPDEMDAILRHIRRQARAAIEETGVNLLHLALGFLEWREPNKGGRPLLAPLILLPVELDRQPYRNRQRYSIAWSGEDLQPNLALIKRLQQDFDIELPPFVDEDGHWPDPESYYRQVAECIRDRKDWRIRRYITLSLFQFGTLLLYRDLDPDNWPRNALINHPHVRQLLRHAPPDHAPFAPVPPEWVDTELELVDLADSSQAEAIRAALDGRSLVIEGPPGTGKSQTITNLIAAFLARGKRVLFISEKLAALEVVKQRLDRLGLGVFCLDMHSHRQQKRAVLERIERRLSVHARQPANTLQKLQTQLARLKERRAEMDALLSILSRKPSRFDLAVSDILIAAGKAWMQLLDAGVTEDTLVMLRHAVSIADPFGIEPQEFEKARGQLELYREVYQELLRDGAAPAHHPWRGISAMTVAEYQLAELEQLLKKALTSAVSAHDRARSFAKSLGLAESTLTLQFLLDLEETLQKAAVMHRLRMPFETAWRLCADLRRQGMPLATGMAGLRELHDVATAIRAFPAEHAAFLRPLLREEHTGAVLRALAGRMAEIRQWQAELGEVFDFSRIADADPQALEDMAGVLEGAGFLSFLFDADYRTVRQRFKSMVRLGKDSHLNNADRAALLRRLAACLRALQEMEEGREWRSLLADLYQGMATDVDALLAVHEWLLQHAPKLETWPRLLDFLYAQGKTFIPHLKARFETDPQPWQALAEVVEKLAAQPAFADIDADDAAAAWAAVLQRQFPSDFARWLHALPPGDFPDIRDEARSLQQAARSHWQDWQAFSQAAGVDENEWLGRPVREAPLRTHLERMEEALKAGRERARAWLIYDRGRQEALRLDGAGDLVRLVEQGVLPVAQAAAAYEWRIMDAMARQLHEQHEELRRFDKRRIEDLIEEYRRLDRALMQTRRALIAARLAENEPPAGITKGYKRDLSEMALVQNELRKTRRHIPIRRLLERAGETLQTLMPCFMMSPLSVAQYLPPGQIEFDVVVMDEASQLRPQHALGAIARGAQVIIVGDDKQLPPTSFFERIGIDWDEEEAEQDEAVRTAESILDLGTHAYRAKMLRWHYRSRHESLIRFSNQRFYKGQLIVFPSALQDPERLGVRLEQVAQGVFHNGINMPEAQAVVQAVIRHVLEDGRSLGVVAMNRQQAERIEELLDQEAETNPLFAQRMRERAEGERLFVKNLENVQGDERDVIFISMTYGPPNPGARVPQRFGPINSDHGWRRLNVLFTRARERMVIFTSMRAADVVVTETGKLGVRALHEFLHYAETGNIPQLDAPGHDRPHEPESPFEEAVIEALCRKGYDCVPQVGVDGFYIDIGVRDPRNPQRFLLGVECDGASYHSLRSARDRDIIRQQHLENLGWTIHRVWSTDWFRAPQREIEIIDHKIKSLMQQRP